MSRFPFIVFAAVALAPFLALAEEGEWGHLTGRFIFDGDPPMAKTLPIRKDNAVFGDTIADESLIVNERNHGISNIVVFLLLEDGDELHIHPSYADTANAKVELAMKDGRFVPHVMLLRTSQTMVQRNKDSVGHNARIDFVSNAPM